MPKSSQSSITIKGESLGLVIKNVAHEPKVSIAGIDQNEGYERWCYFATVKLALDELFDTVLAPRKVNFDDDDIRINVAFVTGKVLIEAIKSGRD